MQLKIKWIEQKTESDEFNIPGGTIEHRNIEPQLSMVMHQILFPDKEIEKKRSRNLVENQQL